MKYRFLFLLPLCLSITACSQEYRVLPADFNDDKENQMMRSWQRQKVHAALDDRLEEFEKALSLPVAFSEYQQKRRDFLKQTYGPMPERCPLNPRVTGTIEQENYRIEKVLFDSLPGFPISANLYLPAGDGPFPGVLVPCGHSANGKAFSSYQKACILLAQNGFVVLCFDPIGQGERRQLIGSEPHPILKPRGEHAQLGVAAILLGRTLGSMMVWDGVRALDYLCSRPEVDAARIGCTGNSGGGNLTSYLMAYDDRILAAAPGCFMTTHRRKNEKPGPGDAEQNLYAQIRDGFDHPDFILSRAPKPTQILCATHDYVPVAGAWEAYRQAKRAYTILGYPERVSLIEANEKHGFSKPLREGVVRFMAHWLQERISEVEEDEEVPVLTDQQLQVTEHGQVNWEPGTRDIFSVYQEHEATLAGARPTLSRELVRKVTGIRNLEAVAESHGGTSPGKMILRPEPGISLPALFWEKGDKTPVVIAPGTGKTSAIPEAERLHSEGHPVLIVEVRDTGETLTKNWRFYGADFYIGQMLGHSWLALRTEDILSSARWLSGETGKSSVSLHADGETVPAAIHARYLEPDLISGLTHKNGLTSWRELMNSREPLRHIHQAVHGALQFYDLPDLVLE